MIVLDVTSVMVRGAWTRWSLSLHMLSSHTASHCLWHRAGGRGVSL